MINQLGSLFPSMNEGASWFAALDSRTRRILFVDPYAELPDEFAPEILNKGRKLAGLWFTEAEESEQFKLPDDIAGYVSVNIHAGDSQSR